MYLIVSPTELEIGRLRINKELPQDFHLLVSGTGIVESAISLTRFLMEANQQESRLSIDGVILFGLCGAYHNSGISILDICLAEKEYFGDFGIAFGDTIQYFDEKPLMNPCGFSLNNSLLTKAEAILDDLDITYRKGNFITVNSCTGTTQRGNFLKKQFNAICENMEGAALARVCDLYNLHMMEMRCVSNMVENRDKSKWQIEEAVSHGTQVLIQLLREVSK